MAHSTPQQFKYVDENVPFFHPRPRRHFDTNLGVVEDEILNMLDGSPRPLKCCTRPACFGNDNLRKLDVTAQASQTTMSKLAGVPRQVLAQNAVRVSATAQVHGPIKSKYVALSGQALKQNASLAQMELQARLGEREFVALAAYSVFPHQHVTVYPPATALVSSDASDYVTKTAEPVSELEAVNRIRESKGLPPLVPKLGQNAQRRENKRLAKQIAQEEDLKYAHNDQDWADLGTTESGSSSEDDSNSDSPSSMEEELALGETPMGREFIRSRALRAYELPPPVEVFDRWRNGVEEHLFLHRNSQYARNQVYWPDISALPVGVDDDFAHQEANSNVFEQRRALIQRSEEDWTLENDHFRRTSLQSPSPGRREI